MSSFILQIDVINFLGISIVGQSDKLGIADGGIYVGSIMKGLVTSFSLPNTITNIIVPSFFLYFQRCSRSRWTYRARRHASSSE